MHHEFGILVQYKIDIDLFHKEIWHFGTRFEFLYIKTWYILIKQATTEYLSDENSKSEWKT